MAKPNQVNQVMTIDWGLAVMKNEGQSVGYAPQAGEEKSPESAPEPVDLENTIRQIRRLLAKHEGFLDREILLADAEAAALLAEIDRLRQDAEAARYYNAVTT